MEMRRESLKDVMHTSRIRLDTMIVYSAHGPEPFASTVLDLSDQGLSLYSCNCFVVIWYATISAGLDAVLARLSLLVLCRPASSSDTG